LAVNPVSLAESLRPWKRAGLSHLLLDAPLEPENVCEGVLDAGGFTGQAASAHAKVSPNSFAANAGQGRRPTAGQGLRENYTHAPQPAFEAKRPHAPHADGIVDRAKGEPAARPEAMPPAQQAGQVRQKEAPEGMEHAQGDAFFSTLPEAWQNLWRKLVPAPVVWSYAELGLDLTGQAKPERSALLKGLIAALGMPKGSSTFWPFCLAPDQVSAQAGGHVFQMGLARSKAKALVLFGPESPLQCGLANAPCSAFTQFIHKGVLVLVLPEMSALLDDSRLNQQTIVFLRATLADLAALRHG